jgi:hypothetical protein
MRRVDENCHNGMGQSLLFGIQCLSVAVPLVSREMAVCLGSAIPPSRRQRVSEGTTIYQALAQGRFLCLTTLA